MYCYMTIYKLLIFYVIIYLTINYTHYCLCYKYLNKLLLGSDFNQIETNKAQVWLTFKFYSIVIPKFY